MAEHDLHTPADEALWGRAGANRRSFLADPRGVPIEVVEYVAPRGRPKAVDHRISDQGMMNVALRSTVRAVIDDIIERLRTDDRAALTAIMRGGELICTYVQAPDRELDWFTRRGITTRR